MSMLVPITLFGWVPLSVVFFNLLSPRSAILYIVIGGTLFLPMAGYDLPGIPAYSKTTSIALGLLIGDFFFGERSQSPFHNFSWCKLPMVLFCLFCPLFSSLSNHLGVYDGISAVINQTLNWGIVYWVGRKYFDDLASLEELVKGIVIGGLLYAPLCLFEVRMSPQLSNIFYDFFPHSFAQHMRYGGYRPIVFMQHGLMVALWMAQSTVAAFWLWRSRAIPYLYGIPLFPIVVLLAFVTILCKSANGWFFLIFGIFSWFLYGRCHSTRFIPFCLLLVPLYFLLRTFTFLPAETIEGAVSNFVDEDRVTSLSIRLRQEDLYGQKALERLWFGWGGYNRGAPRDPDTGKTTLNVVDAMSTIIFSTYGIVGLISIYSALLLGPWFILRYIGKQRQNLTRGRPQYHISAVLTSLVVIIFVQDSLMNGMYSPIYVLCSGALLGCHLSLKKNQQSV